MTPLTPQARNLLRDLGQYAFWSSRFALRRPASEQAAWNRRATQAYRGLVTLGFETEARQRWSEYLKTPFPKCRR